VESCGSSVWVVVWMVLSLLSHIYLSRHSLSCSFQFLPLVLINDVVGSLVLNFWMVIMKFVAYLVYPYVGKFGWLLILVLD
jgi:hypothetical protein